MLYKDGFKRLFFALTWKGHTLIKMHEDHLRASVKYINKNDLTKAVHVLNGALGIGLQLYDEYSLGMNSTYYLLCCAYFGKGEYERALEYSRKGLEIHLRMFSAKGYSVSVGYNNMGLMYSALKDYESALEYYNKSLNISQKMLFKEYDFTASTYYNIAELYREKGEHENALKYYMRSMKTRKKPFKQDYSFKVSMYGKIGFTFGCMGNQEKAIEYFEWSVSKCRRKCGPESDEMADIYERMSDMHYINGVYEKSPCYCRLALSIEKNIHGDNNLLTSRLYKRAAEICSVQQDYRKTLKYGIKAYKAITRYAGRGVYADETKSVIYDAYINLGMPQLLFSDWLAGECILLSRRLSPKPVGKHHSGSDARNAAYKGDGNAVTGP